MATTPYPFVANTVLTASQLNSTFNIPVSTKTASYTLVGADAGTRVVMNAGATNTTITVNTSLFSAGDTLEILNISTSGICTVTAGTATVSTSGTLALVANAGGTLYFTSTGVSVFQTNGVTAATSGLVFLSAATFTAASTVSLPTNTFSATYQNYKISYNVTAASTDSTAINARLRVAGVDSSAASYSNAGVTYLIGGATIGAANILSGTAWQFTQFNSTDRNEVVLEVFAPQLALDTNFMWKTYGRVGGGQGGGNGNGEFRAATQFDSLTLFPTAGTITGNYQVYGYAIA